VSDNRAGLAAYLRAMWAIAAAVILTFFAMQTFYAPKISLPYKIGLIVAIAVIGIAGIAALLTPEPEEPQPSQRLYTADEVAALVAAVQAGRLVAAAPAVCKFCSGADPDATGVDGTHYHKGCFQNAYLAGRT
jgi:hypothetical protein